LNQELSATSLEVWNIFNWSFEFVSDFVLRISDFQGGDPNALRKELDSRAALSPALSGSPASPATLKAQSALPFERKYLFRCNPLMPAQLRRLRRVRRKILKDPVLFLRSHYRRGHLHGPKP
jgi:hypothetical protein